MDLIGSGLPEPHPLFDLSEKGKKSTWFNEIYSARLYAFLK
jgi:hypothetical protein